MAPLTSVLTAALLASAAVAAPASLPGPISRPIPVSQQFSKFFNSTDLKGLVSADKKRAQQLLSGTLAGSSAAASSFTAAAVGSAHATNEAIYYLTSVQVGNPSVNCTSECFASPNVVLKDVL